ncbi:zinc finger protein 282-like isoform X2 [Ambystoma mexicanum]|uniref:zinc finger protein 282-like isoform X2 n=1 Tax=Ambystoma mexicanum TaxID=8296 RepID=UPI0037E8F1F4
MPRQRSDKTSITFCDVTARFSEDEWKLLHEWQEELYRSVMNEIQQAFISLGPLIANSVFSLRAKGKEDLYPVENEHSETRHSDQLAMSDTKLGSDVLQRTRNPSKHCLLESQSPGTDCFRPDHEPALPVVSFIIKEEDDADYMDHLDTGSMESITKPAESKVLSSKLEALAVDHLGMERREQRTGFTAGNPAGFACRSPLRHTTTWKWSQMQRV